MHAIRSSREGGISLLFVVLIGSIMLLTSVAAGLLALRLVKSASVRSESVRAQYAAEAAFSCVVHWLKVSVTDYFNITDSGHNPPLDHKNITCLANSGGTTENTTITVDQGDVYHKDASGNLVPSATEKQFTFTLYVDNDPVSVTVVRNIEDPNVFRGTTTVLGRNMNESSAKQLEKMQEYYFEWPAVKPSDIMFVVDRSASISCMTDPAAEETCTRDMPQHNSQWELLVNGLMDSVVGLLPPSSPAYVGLVSYGALSGGTCSPASTDPNDDSVGCDSGLTVQPETALTNDIQSYIDTSGPEDTLIMRTGHANTNTSLGLAVAGAKLMGKQYQTQGQFEEAIATDADNDNHDKLDALPNDTGGSLDRDDDKYPDYIILVTDGQPNAIISHADVGLLSTIVVNTIDNNLEVEAHTPTTFSPGDTKFFLTYAPGGLGKVENNGYISVNTGGGSADPPYPLPPVTSGSAAYSYCNDNETIQPLDKGYQADLQHNYFGPNDAPNVAMCNAEIIADALKDPAAGNITIGVIGIGSGETSIFQQWLKYHIASGEGENRMYGYADSFEDFKNVLKELVADKLELNKMR